MARRLSSHQSLANFAVSDAETYSFLYLNHEVICLHWLSLGLYYVLGAPRNLFQNIMAGISPNTYLKLKQGKYMINIFEIID